MLNKEDIKTLRSRGTSNSEILKMIGRVVPSASKAYSQMEADDRTPAAAKDSIIGKMLDENTPENAPSGLPYIHAVSISSAQKSYDSLESKYKQIEGQESPPVDDGFTVGGLVQGVGKGLKGMARAALGVPMVGTYHLFKTADDLATLLSGGEKTKITPKQQQFIKDLHGQAYKDLPQAAMLYSGMSGMKALQVGLTSGGIAAGERALAKAGVAPEGMAKGREVSALSVSYEGAKSFIDGLTTFTGPMKSVILKNTIYNAASQVLDGMVYDTPDKSMGQLLEDSLAGGITSGLVYKGAEKYQAARAVKDFITGDVESPKATDGAPPPGGDGAPGAPKSVIPGEQFNPSRPASMGQGAIEQISGLRPGTQEAAADPQMRSMVEDFTSGKVSPQKLVLEDLAGNFQKTMKDVSDTGAEYNFVRNSKQSMFLPVDDFRAVLKKYDYAFTPEGKATSNPVDGLMTQPGTVEGGAMAKPISGAQFDHLTRAMNILEAPSVTPQMFRVAKSLLHDLGSFYDPKLPGGGGDARAMAGEMLSVLEGARRSPDAPSDFRRYAELDDKYAPIRKEYDAMKSEFFEADPVTGDLRFKDNAPSKILNAMRGTKYNLLERLERSSPGITRKIKAYEAYRNIVETNVPGQYMKSAAKTVGAMATAGFVSGGGFGAAALGVVGLLASSPTVMWSALHRYSQVSKSTGWDPLGIVMKAEHGAPFTPAEAEAVRGTVKVITERYAAPQDAPNPVAEARLVNLKGGKQGTPGIDYPAEPPKGLDMEALIAKYGSEDAIPMNELSLQGVADAKKMDQMVKDGKTPQEAAKELSGNSTDSLASPRPSRDNKGATSPESMNKTSYMDVEDVVAGGLKDWRANGDPDALLNALEDPGAKKFVSKELQKGLRGEDPFDYADEVAGQLRKYMKQRDAAPTKKVGSIEKADDTIPLGEVYDGQASIKRSDVIEWFDTKKSAQSAIDNGEVGERAHNVDIVKVDGKFGVYRTREVRVAENSVDGVNEDGSITIDPKRHPEFFKAALKKISGDNNPEPTAKAAPTESGNPVASALMAGKGDTYASFVEELRANGNYDAVLKASKELGGIRNVWIASAEINHAAQKAGSDYQEFLSQLPEDISFISIVKAAGFTSLRQYFNSRTGGKS